MKGLLEYFKPGSQIVVKELSKEQTAFGPAQVQAVIEWQPARATWTILCANPNAGLTVNGRSLTPGARVALGHFDVITSGTTNVRFLRIPEPPQMRSSTCWEVFLGQRKLVIGRMDGDALTSSTQPADVEFWNLDNDDRSISKIHVEIRRESAGFVIYDRSRTGTYLNGSAFEPRPLVPGDRFNVGSYYFEFTGTSVRCVDQVCGARVEGRGLTLEVPHGDGVKRILKGVSIEIKAGEFLGVLGGSGQGKSTLMNILAGLSLATDGEILVDGAPAAKHRSEAGAVGFVPQDDIVHHELRVRDAITLTAKLRLSVPDAAIEKLVSSILHRLGLERQAQQPISSLSGGQRKRVNIATELLARPPVLFLDEPTSGLDPENEEGVISTLQNLCLTGQTVVCTTHSLHKAYLFDRIAFIHDGRLMFMGTQDEARSHFLEVKDATATESSGASVKLERIYKLLSEQKDTEKWEQKFVTSPLAPFQPDAPPPPRRVVASLRRQKRPGFLTTLSVLIQTQWSILRADPRNWKSLLLQAVGIGALAGWVGRDDPEFRFFACLIATLWFGCSNAAQTITRELPIFRRERIAGLSLHPYILSKTAFLSVISWLQVVMLLLAQAVPVLLGGATGLVSSPGRDIFPGTLTGMGLFGLAFGLAGVVGVMIGLSLSSHARTTTQATLWVPLVLIPQILFSGFVVTLPEMPPLARFFSHAVPSASAQRLLDAGNIAGARMPLMTDKTEVPMFLWTDFKDTMPGKLPQTLIPLAVVKKIRVDGRQESMRYREVDEYATSWQNVAVDADKTGKVLLLPHSGKPEDEDADGDGSSTKNYLYKRPDVVIESGSFYAMGSAAVQGVISLLAWVVACYGIIWVGLTLAQPETLRPAWARRLSALDQLWKRKPSGR
ncbi:ATP-binding cassette domain-containing protein [Prosthecobacter sp. SYSU 5D2]|uniref:ATP-binding cassette domain-containing protein n=1 Tax=Prosthecobacter sp. SYSU 5D2 TaxID=3134134 RepID=UPI0031FF3465